MNDKNNMLALSQERFSARKFTPEAVSQEDLDYIMECVRLAPSAVNRQPWRWLIVRSEEAKKKLQDCYDREWFKTAPIYIIGMKNVNENWVRRYDEKPHGDSGRASLSGCHRKGTGYLLGLQLRYGEDAAVLCSRGL